MKLFTSPHWLRLTILLLGLVNLSYGATLYSILSVDNAWTSTTTWSYTNGGTSCSCTPQPGDLVIISHTIIINDNITYMDDGANASFISIQSTGTLSFEGTGKLNLHTGSIIELDTGGKIRTDNLNDANDKIRIGGTEVWRSKCTGSLVSPHCGNVDGAVSLCLDTSGDPTSTCTGLPLPSLLFSLKGNYNNDQQLVTLVWSTSNADRSVYQVERSVDGVHFETIETISSTTKPIKIQQISVADKHPLPNLGYYRIQQISSEGSHLSQVIKIQAPSAHSVTAYPNPVATQGTLNLWFDAYEGTANVFIYNLQGQPVLVQKDVAVLPRQPLGLALPSHIGKGVYMVKVLLTQQTHTFKLLVK